MGMDWIWVMGIGSRVMGMDQGIGLTSTPY